VYDAIILCIEITQVENDINYNKRKKELYYINKNKLLL